MTLTKTAYTTNNGVFFAGKIEGVIKSPFFVEKYKGKIDLIFTSPPFPLNRKKRYGNLQGQEYLKWITGLADQFKECIKPEGSIVIEVGNSWVKGEPTMSTLALESLLAFKNAGGLYLCQQFIWNNPARLPSPAQWVNIERIRVKDAFTHIWWMSPTPRPKANNRNVLTEYSSAMKKLLENQKYNSGERPSEHNIGEKSFLKNNKGAIPSNVITIANTKASSDYLNYCRENQITPHPARMPDELAEFFIKFLTEPGDLIFDPFAGSNTTGAVAEKLERKWLSVEVNEDYILGSKGRFPYLIQ